MKLSSLETVILKLNHIFKSWSYFSTTNIAVMFQYLQKAKQLYRLPNQFTTIIMKGLNFTTII